MQSRACGGDDGVRLGMDASAELIPFTAGDAEPYPSGIAHIQTSCVPLGAPLLPVDIDLIVVDYLSRRTFSKPWSVETRLGNIEIIVLFIIFP